VIIKRRILRGGIIERGINRARDYTGRDKRGEIIEKRDNRDRD
jgi:hypothetical protein